MVNQNQASRGPEQASPDESSLNASFGSAAAAERETSQGFFVCQPAPGEKIVDIEFVKAAAHIGGKPSFIPQWSEEPCFELWHDESVRVVFDRFPVNSVSDVPALPPYSATLMSQPDVSLYVFCEGNGWSSLSGDTGHALHAGANVLHLYSSIASAEREEPPFMILTINLDQTNDWSHPARPAVSAESRALKKSWDRFWHPASEGGCVGFNLEGTKRKPLELKTAEEMRALPGPAQLIKRWEEDLEGEALEDSFAYDQRYTFAYDPKSKSYAMGEYSYNEGDHRLYIFKGNGACVGFYRVQDDGTRKWYEAYSGELGKA